MFGSSVWGAFGASEDHLSKERDPPARATLLEFPTYSPPRTSKPLTDRLASRLRKKTCHTRSFSDITDEDLASLNVDYRQDVPLSDFITADQYPIDRPYFYDGDLEAVVAEASVENEDAFREVLRMDPLPGRKKPRLAYSRNLFGSLEDMARYFDVSRDEYYQVPVKKQSEQKPNKNIDGARKPAFQPRKEEDQEMIDAPPQSPRFADVSKPSSVPTPSPSGSTSSSPNDPAITKEVYRGYRLGNAENMNPGTRVAMVRNLLKMVVHKFQCRDHEPMPAPREKFIFRGVKIQSIQYQFCIARVPEDVKMARARMVEGPIMAVQIRDEIRFKPGQALPQSPHPAITANNSEKAARSNPTATRPDNFRTGYVNEKFDFLREIGCMLILANQRAREHKSREAMLGNDRWWVTQHRWGGGTTKWGLLPNEVYEDEDPSWSPEERRLQEEKIQREEEERARGNDPKAPIAPMSLRVDDLIAKPFKTPSPSPSATPSPVSYARPAVPGDPMPSIGNNGASLDMLRPRKKKLRSLSRPASQLDDPTSFRDGRRLMYVPPFRKKWYVEWQNLRPNTPVWDDKIVYKQIGKAEPELEPAARTATFDDIYMVSSVNHHVCLVKMRVSAEYLRWVEEGTGIPDATTGSSSLKKNVLYVQRSEWKDMFDPKARVEFLTALWRVMCWMHRKYVPESEWEKMEAGRDVN